MYPKGCKTDTDTFLITKSTVDKTTTNNFFYTLKIFQEVIRYSSTAPSATIEGCYSTITTIPHQKKEL